MRTVGSYRQRGITFLGLIFVAIVLAVVGVLLAQVLPTTIEYYTIQNAVQKSAEGKTPTEVREIFAKAISIDNIHAITADELEVSKQGDKVQVRFSYQREIHLVGPAFLTLKYKGRSN